MDVSNQSVEEWAASAQFSLPLRLGDVEAGILARAPAPGTKLGWWYPLVVLVSWAALALAFIFGMGSAIIGSLLVLIGSTREDPVFGEQWLGFATFVFLAGVVVQISLLHQWWRNRRRTWSDPAGAAITIVCCWGSLALLRSVASEDQPRVLSPAIVLAGGLAALSFVVHAVSRPPGTRASSKKPRRRGPRNSMKAHSYEKTRERVLDILVERRLLKTDEDERRRLLEMPLGYWEELDGVEERERRRILEYRLLGWREFDENDRRPWPSAQDSD